MQPNPLPSAHAGNWPRRSIRVPAALRATQPTRYTHANRRACRASCNPRLWLVLWPRPKNPSPEPQPGPWPYPPAPTSLPAHTSLRSHATAVLLRCADGGRPATLLGPCLRTITYRRHLPALHTLVLVCHSTSMHRGGLAAIRALQRSPAGGPLWRTPRPSKHTLHRAHASSTRRRSKYTTHIYIHKPRHLIHMAHARCARRGIIYT